MFTNGLHKLPKDKRDLKVASVFGVPKEIPKESFNVAVPLNLKDQGQSFRCAGYAAASVAEIQEGVPLSGDFAYGKAKELEGDMLDGSNLRTLCKVATKIGFIEESEWKEDFNETEIKEWWKWKGKYEDFAVKHRKKAYFAIDTSGDFFDNIRAALWEHRDKKCFVLVGTTWYSGWTGEYITKAIGDPVGGHALFFFGQKIKSTEYLSSQNSAGPRIGDNGRQHFSREVVNKYFKPYGAFMFIDMEEQEVRKLIEQQTEVKSLMSRVIGLLTQLVDLLAKKKLS